MHLARRLLERIPRYRRLQAERQLAGIHHPWAGPLLETQNELAELVPGPYYKGAQNGTDASGKPISFPPYREAEIYYWTNVPRWIWEDTRHRKLGRSLDVGCARYSTYWPKPASGWSASTTRPDIWP